MQRQQSQLAQTHAVLQQAMAAQVAARDAARTAAADASASGMGVPNGLTSGGLRLASQVPLDLLNPQLGEDIALWQGANLPEQTVSGAQVNVRIKQNDPLAFLTWEAFNVGLDTTVEFVQSRGGVPQSSWVAFNQVNDPSGNPSQILGQITAPGEVYIINRNGVVFGGSSQVNLRSLTVSALPLNRELVDRGLLNNPDAQFLFSGLNQPSGPNGTPAFEQEGPPAATGRFGDIMVEPGAVLTANVSAEGSGGRITLVGANIEQGGTIRTPAGQTILAAGLQVGLAAHSSDDPSLRGLDAYVGAIAAPGAAPSEVYAGTVTQTGVIEVPRGNASLVGRTVNVSGVIESSTSVALNGRIDLLANYGATSNPIGTTVPAGYLPFLNRQSGVVRLEENSLIRILPEYDSDERVSAEVLPLRSRVNMQGRSLYLGEDSSVLAPSGLVNLTAGEWNFITTPQPQSRLLDIGGQIYLDRGASISVAGTAGAEVPVSQNFLEVDLRGAELADSPLQRNSFLRGQTITVDIRERGVFDGREWIGTPLANISGFIGLIERDVAELTTPAGNISLIGGGSVVLQETASLDVSNGWVNFIGGEVETTRLLADGQVVNIAQATPDRLYDGIFVGGSNQVSTRWGTTERFTGALSSGGRRFEESYVEGRAGGTLTLQAAAMALDGVLLGNTIVGERQAANPPKGTALALNFQTTDAAFPTILPIISPTPPTIFVGASGALDAVGAFNIDANDRAPVLPTGRTDSVFLPETLFGFDNFNKLSLFNRDGQVTFVEGLSYTARPLGSLSVDAANIDILGDIRIPGGTIDLLTASVSLSESNQLLTSSVRVNPTYNPSRGNIFISGDSVVSTQGLLVDQRSGADPAASVRLGTTQGGTVRLRASSVVAAEGSLLDVSGGLRVDSRGRFSYGNAGSLTIATGRDTIISSVLGGVLDLNSSLRGFSGTQQGGALSLTASRFQIGGESADPSVNVLDTEFFSTNGFSSFNIRGIGAPTGSVLDFLPGVVIAENTVLAPEVRSLFGRIDQNSNVVIDSALRREGERAPVDLSFAGTGAVDPYASILVVRSEVDFRGGAEIRTDAGSSVRFSANAINFQGNVLAPGGMVEVLGGNSLTLFSPDLSRARANVIFGGNSGIDTSGKAVVLLDSQGLRRGTVHQGGSIRIDGNILAQSGARFDVSGTSGVLDIAASTAPEGINPASLDGFRFLPTTVQSAGGSIALNGSELLLSNAEFVGHAGGSAVRGGDFSFSSGRFDPPSETTNSGQINLRVKQGGAVFNDSVGMDGFGLALQDTDGNAIIGGGRIAAESFAGGGFDGIFLGGAVQFDGAVDIRSDGSIIVGTAGVIQTSDHLRLSAPYVRLGQSFQAPIDPTQQRFFYTQTIPEVGEREFNFSPTAGSGVLEVAASNVDLGTMTLQNISLAEIVATDGSIRGNGVFNLAGDLTLAAAQTFPTTAASFTVTAFDYIRDGSNQAGTVRVQSTGIGSAPFSAAGTLNIYASEIHQGGSLFAPFGRIDLGWDGEGTAPVNRVSNTNVPITETLVLEQGSLTSVAGLDGDVELNLPFGLVQNGALWFDPRGVNITFGGLPEKAVNLAARNLLLMEDSLVDNRGGGDLFAYEFLPGTGGSRDILEGASGFAILPGFDSSLAPFAPFNPNSINNSLGGDPGYVAPGLAVGRRIFLEGSDDLAAGFYTLLPARYALLPGAFLVNQVTASTAPLTSARPDGSFVLSGFEVDSLSGSLIGNNLRRGFEVIPQEVVLRRSEFRFNSANEFLADAATARSVPIPRLPADAGRLTLSANQTISIAGLVASTVVGSSGRGGQVDISSPLDVFIGGSGADAGPGFLSLDAGVLNAFGAGSLLIGGRRTSAADDALVAVGASQIIVDNAGAPLVGEDIILVAQDLIVFEEGAEVESNVGGITRPGDIRIGDSSVAGSGDGVLARFSSRSGGNVVRNGVTSTRDVNILIEDGANFSANTLTLDSSAGFDLRPGAEIEAVNLDLRSGQISFVLDDLVPAFTSPGLVLDDGILDQIFASSENLSLLSYSTIDFLGTGRIGSEQVNELFFDAAVLQRIGASSGDVEIVASRMGLSNSLNSVADAPVGPSTGGVIRFDSGEFALLEGASQIRGMDRVEVAADERFVFAGPGSLAVEGDLFIDTPALVAGGGADQRIEVSGSLSAVGGGDSAGLASEALAGNLQLVGDSIEIGTTLSVDAGRLSLEARAGDLVVNQDARLQVGGVERTFFDQTAYVNGGRIELSALLGDVILDAGSLVDVSADPGGGHAGSVRVKVSEGSFLANGTLLGSGDTGGSFFADFATMATNEIDTVLNAGGFTNAREFRVRSGDVEVVDSVQASRYSLAADAGSINVTGQIDASGETGGQIVLRAADNLTVGDGAVLSVAAEKFSNAGTGGRVFLESGATVDGFTPTGETLTLASGAIIDISVAAATAESTARGQHEGVLLLRAPQNASGTDLALAPVESTIIGGSHISVEGFRVYDLTGLGDTITSAVQNQIRNDGLNFLGSSGITTANYTNVLNRISGGDAAFADRILLKHGAEVINRDGDLILGSASSNNSADWDLADVRFGPRGTAGNLTLRASDDIRLFNSLSDGFAGGSSLWLSPLKAFNELLPANDQSWSYRIVAGADLSAADFREVLDPSQLADDRGYLRIGKNQFNASVSGGNNARTQTPLNTGFQVIRTGSGSIDIATGRSLQLLNPFASIYTAGTAVPDATELFSPGDFSLPLLRNTGGALSQGGLGTLQQLYPVQYASSGGDIEIRTGLDMERLTQNALGELIPDSSRQLPNNWLMRRGYVDGDGQYGSVFIRSGFSSILNDPSASTTWWVDYSNYFFAVGSLGGGNISLTAGRDVRNIEAAIPTNARAASGTSDPSRIVELGGGDLQVSAGRNIDGGLNYVERGDATLFATNEITTNRTRSQNLNILESLSNPTFFPEETWMPTALFLGKGSIEATALQNVRLGPVANTFLLPQSVNNRYWYKTYFSTFASDSQLSVQSVAGDVNFSGSVTAPNSSVALPHLERWLSNHNVLNASTSAFRQPWLRLAESSVAPFEVAATILPPQLSLTSFSGDIRLGGSMNLAPSPVGSLNLFSAAEVQGLVPSGISNTILSGKTTTTWSATSINLSDTNPARIPGVTSPNAVYGIVGNGVSANNTTRSDILQPFNELFAESGATNLVLQTQQGLHAPNILHSNNPEPVRVYAQGGDISGLRLFSGTHARILADKDISDVAFYIQNVSPDQTSVVAAGRDIVAFNPDTDLRVQARSEGNALAVGEVTLAGDLQISGPGRFEVIAGRNLDLGVGPTNPDGTALGLSSVGNLRNPFLPVGGADIFAAAGVSLGLDRSRMDISAFTNAFLNPATAPLASRYLGELAELVGADSDTEAWDRFQAASPARQAQLAVDIFYLVLRDAGRDSNDINAPTFGTYANGFAAIEALFPDSDYDGDLALTSRQIRTRAGGDINLLVPGGRVVVGLPVDNNPSDQGILTEAGGNINIFSDENVSVGSSRIFTLRGGNEIIWSSTGDIAAGSAARTVRSAPPTRVIIDPSTAAVQTDLSGLATGGGIGVLQTVAGVPPSDVDLIAPAGVIDAGDAGIRVSGNLNIAAVQVLNTANISVGASSGGVPSPSIATPNVGSLAAASGSSAAASAGLGDAARRQARGDGLGGGLPSIISVQVIGFGGSVPDGEEEEDDRRRPDNRVSNQSESPEIAEKIS